MWLTKEVKPSICGNRRKKWYNQGKMLFPGNVQKIQIHFFYNLLNKHSRKNRSCKNKKK